EMLGTHGTTPASMGSVRATQVMVCATDVPPAPREDGKRPAPFPYTVCAPLPRPCPGQPMSDQERPDRPAAAEGGPAPPPAASRRGVRALRRLLREQTFDLRNLDVGGFRRWLDVRLERWRQDPVFAQRARVRDLRRAHPQLPALEQEHRRAARAEAASAHYTRLRRLEQELLDADNAVSGLTTA